MNRKFGLILAIIAFTMSIATAAPNTEANETDPQKFIVVQKKSPQFTIQLKSNPTTGYQWFLQDYPSDIIASVSHQYIAPDNQLIGAPGMESFKFTVKPSAFAAPRRIALQFHYVRPWNPNETPEARTIHILLKP